jgi:gamma-glutamyltranspeptidase/glutathione hydrolase
MQSDTTPCSIAQYLADDNFHEVPVQSLIDDDYLKARSKLIDSNKANINICFIAINELTACF